MKQWIHNLFVPHPGNDHAPHFWRDRSIGLLLAVILLAELAVFAQSFLLLNKNSYFASVLPGVLASLTNDQRTANQAVQVKENQLLVEAAQLKASDMAARGYFSHDTPEGQKPWYFLQKVGYTYDLAGENLAVDFYDSKDVVDAWMKSPTHRENIVHKSYTEMGIATALGVYQGRPAVYVAQFFGTPKAIAVNNVAKVVAISTPTRISTTTTSNTSAVVKTTNKTTTTTIATSTATSSASTTVATDSATTSTSSQVAGALVDIRSTTSNSAADEEFKKPNIAESLAASPRHAGMIVLVTLLSIIVAALLILLFMTGHTHHPRILLLTIAFILMISGLLILNTKLFKDTVEVGEGQTSFVSTEELAI